MINECASETNVNELYPYDIIQRTLIESLL